MLIKKALKEKKKVIAKITDLIQKAQTYNSVEEGVERSYDPVASLDGAMKAIDELVELKTKIHLANAKVHAKIFRLSEIKSLLSRIKSIDCTAGKFAERWSREQPVVKTALITLQDRDTLIQELEAEIERIQEELDTHNSTVSI